MPLVPSCPWRQTEGKSRTQRATAPSIGGPGWRSGSDQSLAANRTGCPDPRFQEPDSGWLNRMLLPNGSRRPQSIPYGRSVGSSVNSTPLADSVS